MSSRRNRQLARLLLLSVLVAGWAAGSTSNSSAYSNSSASRAAGPSRASVTVRLANTFAGTFDPQLVAGDHGTVAVVWYPYDRLIAMDPKTGKLTPYLATAWKITSKAVTFTIRKGATCSDGTPVTAGVVGNSLKRLVSDDIVAHSKFAWGRYYLGPGPYAITANNKTRTVTFAESVTNTELIYAFLWPQLGIICPAGFSSTADFTHHSYGSGPYVITNVSADTVTMQRRPNWNWGPEGAKNSNPGVPNTILLQGINNETTAANAMLTGQIQAGPLFGPDVARLKANKSIHESDFFSFISEYMYFNEDAGHPTADPAVRHALMYTITQGAWLQAAMGGNGRITPTGVLEPGTRCYDPHTAKLLPRPVGALDKAKAILLADGYTFTNGQMMKDGKQLSITVLSAPNSASGPQYVQSQIQKLGINVTLSSADPGTNLVNLLAGKFDVTFNTTGFAVASPGTALDTWNGLLPPTAGSNGARTNDPVLVKDLATAHASLGCTAWKAVQERLLTNYHMLPLPALEWQWFSIAGMQPIQGFGAHQLPYTVRRSG